jgi:hypothetical protein
MKRSGFRVSKKYLTTAAVALILTFAVILVLRIYFRLVSGGMGVTPDSVNYLQIANNLVKGNAFISFGKQFINEPPGYAIAIAILSTLRSGDTMRGAYWLQALIIVFNILLVGLAAWIATLKKLTGLMIGLALFCPPDTCCESTPPSGLKGCSSC